MPDKPIRDRALTADELFAGMHRQLRVHDSDIPESPDRLDPIMRILLRLFADQLAGIDKRLDLTWQQAADALIRAVAPESRLWPVPAYTVMRCLPSDPAVEVDPHTRFYFREKREGAVPLYFSTLHTHKLLAATMRHVFVRLGETVIDCSPEVVSQQARPPLGTIPRTAQPAEVYLAIDYQGPPSALKGACAFLKGAPDALKQLRWGQWFPGSNAGSFYDDAGFCPGLTSDLESVVGGEKGMIDWGGLRSSHDLFRDLEDNFALPPSSFTSTWELGRPDEQLQDIIARSGAEASVGDTSYYWIRVDLPERGDRTQLLHGVQLFFDCALVVNKNELTLFKHTGGGRLVEIELPEPLAEVLEIEAVVDSSGRNYLAAHELGLGPEQRTYAVQQRDDHLVLWFDFSGDIETPPDSITVTYSVTAGTAANAVESGKIIELYENHPGLSEVTNLIPTTGAIPARGEEETLGEVALRLRDRNRAITFDEIERWVRFFDPRVTKVDCDNGVQRAERGLRRCVAVWVAVDAEKFYSDDEMGLLQQRLTSFLKSRSTVNTQFQVEILAR